MSELAVRQTTTTDRVGPDAGFPTAQNAMRLVEWAEEAQAAHHLAAALVRTPFAGSWRNDVDGATAAILKGSEVGLTPVTALGAFDNIQGTPAPKAITLRALVQSHGHDLEIVEETDERAVARYRRHGKGEWLTTEFTVAHARAMNLLGKDNWKKQLGAMLVARVTSKAARLVASDVILGIGYSAEEVRDEGGFGERPAHRQVPASGSARMRSVLDVEPDLPSAADMDEANEPDAEPAESPLLNVRSALAKAMYAAFNESTVEEAERIVWISNVIDRDITSTKEMTEDEARVVLDHLGRQNAGADA